MDGDRRRGSRQWWPRVKYRAWLERMDKTGHAVALLNGIGEIQAGPADGQGHFRRGNCRARNRYESVDPVREREDVQLGPELPAEVMPLPTAKVDPVLGRLARGE